MVEPIGARDSARVTPVRVSKDSRFAQRIRAERTAEWWSRLSFSLLLIVPVLIVLAAEVGSLRPAFFLVFFSLSLFFHSVEERHEKTSFCRFAHHR